MAYHEYTSPTGRLIRRHFNGRRCLDRQQLDEYQDPDSGFWEDLAKKSCDIFHDLAGMTAPVYEKFIEYLEAENFHGKTWKEINSCFQTAIHAFQIHPDASSEALAWCAGVLPEELMFSNGSVQAVVEVQPCPKN